MECIQCRGEPTVGTASYTVNRRGYHLIIDDVPAFICTQCQESLFTEEAVHLVQQMVRALDARREELDRLEVVA